MSNENKPVVKTAVKARGARLGRPVLWVLIVGTLLAVIAMVFVFAGTPKP